MRKRRLHKKRVLGCFIWLILLSIGIVAVVFFLKNSSDRKPVKSNVILPDWITEDIIDENAASRSGVKLDGIKDIVVHYVGNPNTTAQQNRSFFNNPDAQVNSHFVVGLDGEIILALPLDEKSSASNHRNKDTISIEVCHPDETGKFTETTQAALVKLVAWLCDEYNLKKDNIIRHYDVTGKNCPLYFVTNEDAWHEFKQQVETYRKVNK